jgi:hypothetical protein
MGSAGARFPAEEVLMKARHDSQVNLLARAAPIAPAVDRWFFDGGHHRDRHVSCCSDVLRKRPQVCFRRD